MSLSHSPKVVTNGLVFYMDQGNTHKSWKGAPATNLFTETNLNNWSKSATTSTSAFVTPHGDPAYDITDSNSSSYLSISRSVTVANDSSSYTLSLFVRKTYGATSARLGFNFSFTGGTPIYINPRFNSDTGVATYGTVIDYGDWWYWYYTVTNNSTGNTSLNHSFYPATGIYNGSDNVIGVGTAIVGSFMLVAGSIAARFTNGTRSNTQAILDLTNNNIIVANSLTYASNNTFSFNGTTDRIYTSTNTTYGNNTTWEAWVLRTASLDTYNTFMGRYLPYFGIMSDNSIIFSNRLGGTQQTMYSTGFTAVNNTWYHLVFTTEYDGSTNTTSRIYINGTLNNSRTVTGTQGNEAYAFTVGRWYPTVATSPFQGRVDSIKVYNRTLSATEVRQNFNALRGRYGI